MTRPLLPHIVLLQDAGTGQNRTCLCAVFAGPADWEMAAAAVRRLLRGWPISTGSARRHARTAAPLRLALTEWGCVESGTRSAAWRRLRRARRWDVGRRPHWPGRDLGARLPVAIGCDVTGAAPASPETDGLDSPKWKLIRRSEKVSLR